MIKFVDTRTKTEVEYPEPPDILAAGAEESARLYALGTPEGQDDAAKVSERAKKVAATASRTITAMDNSRRWKRVGEEIDAAAPEPEEKPKRGPGRPPKTEEKSSDE